MFENWHDFNKEKPKICHVNEATESKWSDQILLYIDNKIYIGHYLYDNYYDHYEYSLETAGYEFFPLAENYDNKCHSIYEKDFKKHEIYWHSIDNLGIICAIDLLKKENE